MSDILIKKNLKIFKMEKYKFVSEDIIYFKDKDSFNPIS
jgi:hypothetical protein